MHCKMMNDMMIYLIFGFGLLLAELFLGVEGKCSLARFDEDRRLERTIAYVCIHGDLSDLKDVPIEAEWIEFTIGRLHQIPADAFSKYFNLRRLTFYNCEIRELNLDAFRGLNGLEWLVFSNTKLNVAKANMFKYIPNLKMLTLDSTGLIYIEPQIFKILGQRLETLSLRNNDLDCLPVDDLASMKRLKTVRIDENPWMCDCRRALLKFFENRKIQQHSLPDKYNIHHRRKRWSTNHYNETYSSLSQSYNSTNVYDCMAVLNYPELPPIQAHTLTPHYDYSYQQRIEWRESTATSIAYLDRLPDEIGWIELFDLHTPTLHRYTFFRFGNTLRSITLNNCGIEFIESEAFAGLHKIERLTIIGARLRTVATSWFRDLTRLTDLILERASIEMFENGALDHLRNLRRLDLRANRLNCLPQQSLQGIISLERLEASENPWFCSCRRNLESYLIRKQIGYEISNSRADSIGCIEDNEHTTIIRPTYEYENFYNATKTGRIRWSWGYETRAQKPSRLPPTPRPPAILETTPPPIAHQSGCRSVSPHHYHHHHRYNHLKGLSYVCTRGALVDIQELPSTVETIIFTNCIIHTLRSNIFRKFDGFLKRLEFRDCAIQSIDDGSFSGLRNLEDLVINDNDIEVIRPEWFREVPTLRHLDLARNNIARIENGVFDMLPALTSIDISDNVLNCIGIERLEKLKYLRELNIVGNPWTCLCATRFARFINERNIYCAGNCLNAVLEDDGISNWGGCHSTGVHQTSISETTTRPTTSTVMPTLYPHILLPAGYTNTTGTCSSTHEHTHYHCSNGDIFLMSNVPSNVRSLEIYDSYVPHLPAASFARFENLTELIIRNCSLKDIDPRTFQGLHRLEKLVIHDNRLSIVRNSWFKDCHNLYWLDLSKNNLAEIEIGAFDNLKQLQYLNLEDNAFECIYTSCFIHLPRLDTFEFSRNPLKWRCWQDIRQFLEIRAIGYTYYKCPHNSRDLIKTLQDNGTHLSSSTRHIGTVGFIILTTILSLINAEKTFY